MGKDSVRERESVREKVEHFNTTFGIQNHQLNHFSPADLEKLCLLALSEFCLNYNEKNQSHNSYPFLN